MIFQAGQPHDDQEVIEGFRSLLKNRLGDLALAVFDLRMAGGETKSLVGSPSVGSPSQYEIKRVVGEVKVLAREFAQRRGDPALVRDVQRAMEREGSHGGKTLGNRSGTADPIRNWTDLILPIAFTARQLDN